MNQYVLDELLKNKVTFNQMHGHEFHPEADTKCLGDIIEIFNPAGDLVLHVCSECGQETEV